MLNLVQETYMTPSFYFQWRCHSKTKKKPCPSSREKSVPTGCFALCSQHEKMFSNSLFSLFLSLSHPCSLDLPLWMRRSFPQTIEEGTAKGQGWWGWTMQQRLWPYWRVWVLPGLLQLYLCPPELQEMGDGMDSCPRNKDVAHVYLRDSSGLYH